MRKIYPVIILLLIWSASTYAQTITIPATNDDIQDSRQPYGSWYGYERTAIIYTAAEIAQSGNINQIGFYLNFRRPIAQGVATKIYLKTTNNNNFPAGGTTVAAEESGATLVFDQVIPEPSFIVGWVTVNITSFLYNNTSNLEIIIETNATGIGNEGPDSKQFRYSLTGNNFMAQRWAKDYSPPTQTGSELLQNYTGLNIRPNVQLTFSAAVPTISSIAPSVICVNDQFTITGTNLSGATAVNIGANAASIISTSSTQIVASFATAVTGKVTVTNPAGSVTSAQTLTVNPLPGTVSLSVTGTDCDPARTIAATSAGNTIYYQTTPGVNISSNVYSVPITVNTIGNYTYYFRAKSPSGCFGTENSISFSLNNTSVPLTPSITGSGCGESFISASGGSGGNIYFQGTDVAGGHTNLGDGSPKQVTVSGDYYFQEQNACGWGPILKITVAILPVPDAVIVSGPLTFCGSATINATGGTGGTIYFQGTVSGGASTAVPSSAQVVTASGTYYFRARSSGGCWGKEDSIVVAKTSTFSITTQPVTQIVCENSSVSFSVQTSIPSGLTYQWRRGNTPIVNGGSYSGVNTATLTINPIVKITHEATDYNCIITDACGSIATDYVSLTVNKATPAPTTQPMVLQFPTIGVTSILGTFSYSVPPASGYLVVRRDVNTVPANPVNGATYNVGDNVLGAGTYVEYMGPDNFFYSNGLNPGTTYYYWVYAFNYNDCGTSPLYNTVNPLYGSVTTGTNTACASRSTLYWVGNGSYIGTYWNSNSNFNDWHNWSTTSDGNTRVNGLIPTKCNDVVIDVNSDVTIALSGDVEIYGLQFLARRRKVWVFDLNTNARLYASSYSLTVNGNAEIDVVKPHKNADYSSGTNIYIGEDTNDGTGIIDFKANVSMGVNSTNIKFDPAPAASHAAGFIGNSKSKIIIRGDLNMGTMAAIPTDATPGTIEFDGQSGLLQQVLWNNDRYYANFENVVIGNTNSPIVQPRTGTYTPDNILGDLKINNSAILNLGLYQWNRGSVGGKLELNNNATLRLSNVLSLPVDGGGVQVPGSNFPGGFATLALSPSSTVEYNGAMGTTQTIYDVPVYGNLTLSNSTKSGLSYKINTGEIKIAGNGNLDTLTATTLGFDFKTTTPSAKIFVNNSATLITGTSKIYGNGGFYLQDGGILGMGSPSGITSSGATGNVQTVTRAFGTGANYIYNGTVAQNSGNALPTSMNKLIIDNPVSVTLDNSTLKNYNPTDTLALNKGSLFLNDNMVTINNFRRNSGAFTGSDKSGITINGTHIPLVFTSHVGLLKDLVLNNSGSAYVGSVTDTDTLNITGGQSLNNEGSVAVGSGATLTTNGNLTLKSNQYGTARVVEIPEDGGGNALGNISGKVTVERYFRAHNAWRFLSVNTKPNQTFHDAWQEGQISGQRISTGYGIHIPGEMNNWNALGFDQKSYAPAVKWYNPATNNFAGIPNTNSTFDATKGGYLTFVRGDRWVDGVINNNSRPTILRTKGDLFLGKQQTITVVNTGYEFVPVNNPYASPINLTLLDNYPVVYVFDPNLFGIWGYGGIQTLTWDGSNYVPLFPTSGSYGAPFNANPNIIQSGQSFWVSTLSPTAVTFTIKESIKTAASTGGSMFRPQGPEIQFPELRTTLYRINGNNAETADAALQQFDEDFSNGNDGQDALKMKNGFTQNIGIRSQAKILSVERRKPFANADTVFFDLSNLAIKSYRIEFVAKQLQRNGLEGWVEDSYLHTKTPLSLEGATTVDFSVTNVAGSYAADRFRIVFQAPAGPLPVT
ncbi:MAG: hypothetical protein JSS98_13045, partial [Bacteroidetes bacterium]|nr:hypothetical protein [Bacteroidota bacterium]